MESLEGNVQMLKGTCKTEDMRSPQVEFAYPHCSYTSDSHIHSVYSIFFPQPSALQYKQVNKTTIKYSAGSLVNSETSLPY